MTDEVAAGNDDPWADAAAVAALFALDPAGIGGVALRASPGPARDRWLAHLRALLPPSAPLRRLPLHTPDSRLLGGLDLAATLASGQPVMARGALAEADGGVVLLAMAERLTPATVARLLPALDAGELLVERDGFAARVPTRIGLVALDEGVNQDERPPAALLDRFAFHLDLSSLNARAAPEPGAAAPAVLAARGRLRHIVPGPEILEALATAAMGIGVRSPRALLLALRVARVAAALAGRGTVEDADAVLAGRLVLAPRATFLPNPQAPPEPPRPEADRSDEAPPGEGREETLSDLLLAAVQAAIPPDLLAQLRLTDGMLRQPGPAGRAGALQRTLARGRPTGVRAGEPRAGARLNVIETLRAAAPWQPLRRREGKGSRPAARIEVRREDFRITRLKQRAQTTTIFVVDASGSAALHRLAEAKGAVELLLAECYVRRDRVALLAFRGSTAELLLPPTRSLVRAKRSLASLPGGGGTPLAAGVDAALSLAEPMRRRGETPVVVLLTDGRANVARDGSGGRAKAGEEALAAARGLRAAGLTALLVDTAPKPQATARELAAAMGAVYLPLPYADATALSQAVRAVAP